MSRILLIIAIIILNNCASVRNPEGGPVDEIPPTLISTNPQTLTSITPKQKVTIRFSAVSYTHLTLPTTPYV